MKKIHTIMMVLFLLWSASAHAIITESLDKAVTDIESAYQQVDDLTADFAQSTFMVVLDKEVKNRGTLKWKKPGMFFIEYSGSQPKQYISNDKKMWVYVPGDTQVEIFKISETTVSKEALEFMRGFGTLQKNFRIIGWGKQGGTTELTLVPSFSGAPYSKLKCLFGTDNLLKDVTIYNASGNVSQYKFSNIRTNVTLPEEIFSFKKPKGVKEVTVR